jgi:hypothetical protein
VLPPVPDSPIPPTSAGARKERPPARVGLVGDYLSGAEIADGGSLGA